MLLTGERDGYYADFGTVADLAKAFRAPVRLRRPVLDRAASMLRRPADDRPPAQFVVFDQNHDQVGNRAFGDRLPHQARPLAAFCTLLSPFTPMLFMGEEYGEDAPFQFFTDHIDEAIARATREGRRREFAAFASFAAELPDPQDPQTFERSRLTRRVRRAHRGAATASCCARGARSAARPRCASTRSAAGCACDAAVASYCATSPPRLSSYRSRKAATWCLRHTPTPMLDAEAPGTVRLPPLAGALVA